MLPKVFFAESNRSLYCPSDEVLRIRNHATHTKNGTPQKGYEKKDFNVNDMRIMVDFFKKSIKKHPEWHNVYDFKFSSTERYNDLTGFYREVENQGYKISFENISEEYINECVENGKVYLFEIYSKDFSEKSTGKPNLQTLYWKALFDFQNLKNIIYKLDGQAELFYREASIKYSDQIWEQGHHANDDRKKQVYPIIKNRRYAKDTFLFHVPITLNFKSGNVLGNSSMKFNNKVKNFLKNNPDINIIGIDRGERHLAYLCLINQQGKIIKQESLNVLIGSNEKEIDYQKKLNKKEKDRTVARESWGSIEKIKDLKEGYLAHVIHKNCHYDG